MPIYVYKTIETGCDYCRNGFEQLQSMQDKALTTCPECGGKIKKVPASVGGGVPTLSDGHLKDKGFSKLQKRSDGSYEKLF